MESKGRGRERVKGKELAFLKAFLESSDMTVACKKAGISRKTGYRYLESEEFKRVLEESQQEALKDTVRYLQGNLDKCNLTLMKIIASADTAPQVKINAINTVYSVIGKISENLEVTERLEALERALEDK